VIKDIEELMKNNEPGAIGSLPVFDQTELDNFRFSESTRHLKDINMEFE
jgi:hypothetical protein